MSDASDSVEGLSRRRKRISGRALGCFTQSSSKNSVRVGGGWERAGRGEMDVEGATRMMRATAARRGSNGGMKCVG